MYGSIYIYIYVNVYNFRATKSPDLLLMVQKIRPTSWWIQDVEQVVITRFSKYQQNKTTMGTDNLYFWGLYFLFLGVETFIFPLGV